MLPKIIIYFDGGSRGNPGEGYGSYYIKSNIYSNRVSKEIWGENITNNQAEYFTLYRALCELISNLTLKGVHIKDVPIEVRGDSSLVINQLLENWKVNFEKLRNLKERTQELLKQFNSFELKKVPRKEIEKILGH